MLPIKLTIQGLYAFPDRPQEIDFQRLTEAQLFGIFGATGSGKSSILEAISFAVYGETDRLKKTDRRNYNMLNLRANRLWIDFEFLGGQEESKHYRFTAEIRRKSRNFEETFAPKREAFVKEEDGWHAIETKQAEAILGLSYDNFRRTVIIPQGKFQEFLSLGTAERTRMLREIFRLERFELYDKTKKLIQANDTSITREETLLNQLASATSEALSVQNTTLLQQQQAMEAARLRLADLETQLKRFDAQKEIMVQLELKREALKNLKAESEAIEGRKLRLQRYEAARLAFEPLIKRRNELNIDLGDNRKELSRSQRDMQETQDALVVAKRTYEHIKSEFEQRDQLKQQSDEYGRLLNLQNLQLEVGKLEERLKVGTEKINDTQLKLTQAEKQEYDVDARYRALREAAPDLEAILKARDLQSLTTAQADKIAQAKALFDQQGILHKTPVNKWLAEFGKKANQHQKTLAQAEKHNEATILSEHVASLAEVLNAGEPCPVCGATDHPIPSKLQDGKPLIDLVPLKEAAAQTQSGMKFIELLVSELEVLDEKIAGIHAELEKAGIAPKLLEVRLAAAKENQQALKESETALDAARIARQDAEAATKKLHEHKQKLQLEFTQKQAALTAEGRSFRHIKIEDYVGYSVEQVENLKQDALSRFESVGELFKKEQKRVEELLAKQHQLEGGLKHIQDHQQVLTRKEAELILTLRTAVEGSIFENLEEAESILNDAPDVETERLAVEQWAQERMRAESALEQAEAQSKNLDYQVEAHAEVKASCENLKLDIDQKLIDIGSLQQFIEKLKEQLEEKKAIQKRYDALEQRASNLKLPRKLFTASGFVNYVSGIYLRQLCQAANERFRKLTNNRLQLEPTPDNSFAVRDFLNDGQLRSHKTLSGGQVFQASLCLALALADQVQDRARSRQRFFFIDEGFGALDKQSLRLVFEALRALRSEKRIVGIISHVEDLQEDIDTYLKITNDGEAGSVVETSW